MSESGTECRRKRTSRWRRRRRSTLSRAARRCRREGKGLSAGRDQSPHDTKIYSRGRARGAAGGEREREPKKISTVIQNFVPGARAGELGGESWSARWEILNGCRGWGHCRRRGGREACVLTFTARSRRCLRRSWRSRIRWRAFRNPPRRPTLGRLTRTRAEISTTRSSAHPRRTGTTRGRSRRPRRRAIRRPSHPRRIPGPRPRPSPHPRTSPSTRRPQRRTTRPRTSSSPTHRRSPSPRTCGQTTPTTRTSAKMSTRRSRRL